MQIEELESRIENIPMALKKEKAREIYTFVLEKRFSRCLELGFYRGAVSCYIAAALDEIGAGTLESIDLVANEKTPSIEDALAQAGLGQYVRVYREKTGYNWFLKKKIERRSDLYHCRPLYDFCFLDGSKNWTIDGFAFCLVDKLLKPGGWMLFDDFKWTYEKASKKRRKTDGVVHAKLSDEELRVPHIKAIFELLVIPHRDYSEFYHDGNWAWAHKVIANVNTLHEGGPMPSPAVARMPG